VRERALYATFVFLLLVCTTIGGMGVRTASGQALPVISIDPPTNTAAPGGNFTINIIVAGITGSESLYGWEVKISFNPSILNTSRRDVNRGPFLRDAVSPYGYSTIYSEQVDNLIGVVNVGESVFPKSPPDPPYPPTGATGNGTLATITFYVKADGASLLHFEKDRHKLFTIVATSVIEITHEVTDSVFDNREPPFLPPVAHFYAEPAVANVSDIIVFNASASYDPDAWLISYEWDFGDNTTEIYKGKNLTAIVTHAYNQAGNYAINLTVTDYDNLTNTTASNVTVQKEPSTINIIAIPSTTKPGENITITGSIIPPRIGVNVTIRYRPSGEPIWTDLTTVLTNETSQYSYDWTVTTEGIYELMSQWEGDATTLGAESSTISVVIGFQHPIALFTVDPAEPPLVGETVTFDASASYDPDGTIISRVWDFGDNTTGTGSVTTHSYTAVGIYSVTLTLTDDDNLTGIATDDVIVLGHNIAIISVVPSPTTVKIGESVSISVTVTNEGNFTETFNVTAYYADTPIETQTDITLTGGNSTTLTFNWNTVDAAAGNYTIKAVASHVENETDTGDNTRSDGTVTVEKQSSQITISVDPSTITVGQNTDISGTITPTRAGATVTILYRPTEEDWSMLETATTDTNGKYVYSWSPETSGTYEVKARWEGDATHMGAESNVDSVKIRKATAVNIYLFAVAGVGIVVVATIALYFLRARKRKSV